MSHTHTWMRKVINGPTPRLSHERVVLCDVTHIHVRHDSTHSWISCAMSHTHTWMRNVINGPTTCYGVAKVSRLLKIIGLFCRISSLL